MSKRRQYSMFFFFGKPLFEILKWETLWKVLFQFWRAKRYVQISVIYQTESVIVKRESKSKLVRIFKYHVVSISVKSPFHFCYVIWIAFCLSPYPP